jgi:Ca2+-binding RTX toxin-like protein
LVGGLGNDILTGELSNDVMFVTPGGHNTFRFSSALNAKTNKDTITDFTPGTDKIYLDDAIFRKFTGDNSQLRNVSTDNFLVLGNHLQDANDYLIYNDQTGSLYYDADGSGKGAMIEFANLSNHADLTYADISIV